MSSTATGSMTDEAPFSRTNASVAKQKGSVRAGRPQGMKSEAIAPNSNAASTPHITASTPDLQESTKKTPPMASAASNELKPQRPL